MFHLSTVDRNPHHNSAEIEHNILILFHEILSPVLGFYWLHCCLGLNYTTVL